MAYNISRANTPPINAATKDISNTLPCTAAPVPPPDLAVEDDDGLAVDEGDLYFVSTASLPHHSLSTRKLTHYS
jgi:hypothetical protein